MKRRFFGILAALLIALNSGCIYYPKNFYEVDEGKLYRSGQLNGYTLKRKIKELDLQTVVNLRGADNRHYKKEKKVCEELGVDHFTFEFGKALSNPEMINQVLDIYENGEYPIYVHCSAGKNRAAMASALYVLQNEEGFDDVIDQLRNPKFFKKHDHPYRENPKIVDFFREYYGFCERCGEKSFKEWLNEDYTPISIDK